jgi:hypothetical protein
MMRTICSVVFLGVLSLTFGQAIAGEKPAELEPLVEKVLKAHGGEKKLRGVHAFVEKTKTTVPSGAFTTTDRYIQLPDQTRLESEFELGGKRVQCAIVFAGDSGWRKMEGQPAEPYRAAYKGKIDPLKYAGPRAWLRLKDPGHTLTRLPDTKVGERPAFGIALQSGNNPVERMFFDNETSLLIKVEKNISYVEETVYEDYQAVDGIPVARKITRKRDGKTTHLIEVVEFKVADKLDARLFQRP